MGRGDGADDLIFEPVRGSSIDALVSYDLSGKILGASAQGYVDHLLREINAGRFGETLSVLRDHRDRLDIEGSALGQLIDALTERFLSEVSGSKESKQVFSEEERQEIRDGLISLIEGTEDYAFLDQVGSGAREWTLRVLARFQVATADPAPRNIERARQIGKEARSGRPEAALAVLQENARDLRRNDFKLLRQLLDDTVVGISTASDIENADELAEAIRILSSLGAPKVVPVTNRLGESGLYQEMLDDLVRAIRQADAEQQLADIAAELRGRVRLFRLREIAHYSAPGVIERGRDFFCEHWLGELLLGRFLRKVYGSDLEQWPFPIGPELADALDNEQGFREFIGEGLLDSKPLILSERVLPRLLARTWPEAITKIGEELANPTYSRSWKIDEIMQARIGRLLEQAASLRQSEEPARAAA